MSSISDVRREAFSIIELLVTIGVIGVLLAITIPSLSGARGSARQTVCLANLHGLSATLERYQTAYDSTYPFVDWDQPLAVDPPDEGENFVLWEDPWKLSIYWPSTLHDVAPWREHFKAWVCPGSPRDRNRPWRFETGATGMSSYHYTRSFQGDPVLWLPGAEEDPKLIRRVRSAEVLYPSGKVVLFDAEAAHAAPRAGGAPARNTVMLFADGHSISAPRDEATPPASNPFVDTPQTLHDTPGGVRGLDW